MTTVVNKYRAPAGWQQDQQFVYIGRGSIFGNPYKVNAYCNLCGKIHSTGGSTLKCYTEYFNDKLLSDPNFKQAVLKLKGKTLVCFCKPKPCHGDIIAAYVNNLSDGG